LKTIFRKIFTYQEKRRVIPILQIIPWYAVHFEYRKVHVFLFVLHSRNFVKYIRTLTQDVLIRSICPTTLERIILQYLEKKLLLEYKTNFTFLEIIRQNSAFWKLFGKNSAFDIDFAELFHKNPKKMKLFSP
jgi:hypothetical protein